MCGGPLQLRVCLDAGIPKSRNFLSHWLPEAVRRHPGERRLPWPIPCSCLEGPAGPASSFPCISQSFLHPWSIPRASCIPQCSCRYFLIEIICKRLDGLRKQTQFFLLPVPRLIHWIKMLPGRVLSLSLFLKLRTQKKRCELCKIPFALEQKGPLKLPPNLFFLCLFLKWFEVFMLLKENCPIFFK